MPRNAQWTAEEDEELTKLTKANSKQNNGTLDWDQIVDNCAGQILRRSKNAMISRWWKIKEFQDTDQKPRNSDEDGGSDSDADEEDDDDDEDDSGGGDDEKNMNRMAMVAMNNGMGSSSNAHGLLLNAAVAAMDVSGALGLAGLNIGLNGNPNGLATVNGSTNLLNPENAAAATHATGSNANKKRKKRKKKNKRSKSNSESMENAATTTTETTTASNTVAANANTNVNEAAAASTTNTSDPVTLPMTNIIHSLLTSHKPANTMNESDSSEREDSMEKYNYLSSAGDEDDDEEEDDDDDDDDDLDRPNRTNSKRRRLRSTSASLTATTNDETSSSKRVTRSSTRRQKTLQGGKKKSHKKSKHGAGSGSGSGGRSGKHGLISHHNYYRHDIPSLKLMSFDLTQLQPYIQAFENQVLLNESNRGGIDVAEENKNLRKTIILQNTFLTQLYTKIQHQQGVARELVECNEALKFKLKFVHERCQSSYQLMADSARSKDAFIKEMMDKDAVIKTLTHQLGEVQLRFHQQLSQRENMQAMHADMYKKTVAEYQTLQQSLYKLQLQYAQQYNALVGILNVVVAPSKLKEVSVKQMESGHGYHHIHEHYMNGLMQMVTLTHDLMHILGVDAESSNNNNKKTDLSQAVHQLQSKLFPILQKTTTYAATIEQLEKQKKQKKTAPALKSVVEPATSPSGTSNKDGKSKSKSPRKRKRPSNTKNSSSSNSNDKHVSAINNNNESAHPHSNTTLIMLPSTSTITASTTTTATSMMNDNMQVESMLQPNPRKKRRKNDLPLPMISTGHVNNNTSSLQQHQPQQQQQQQRQPPPPIFTPINTTSMHASLTSSNTSAINNKLTTNATNSNNNNNNNGNTTTTTTNAFTLDTNKNWLFNANPNWAPFQTKFTLNSATLNAHYQPLMLQTTQQPHLHPHQPQHPHPSTALSQLTTQLTAHHHTPAVTPQQPQTPTTTHSQPTPPQITQTNNNHNTNHNNNNGASLSLPPSLSTHAPPPLPSASVLAPPLPPPPPRMNQPQPQRMTMDRSQSTPVSNNTNSNAALARSSSSGGIGNNSTQCPRGLELLLEAVMMEENNKKT